MYKVIKFFHDLQDNGYPYNAGDIFPRSGMTVPAERIAELAGKDNKQGVPLIREVEAAPKKPAAKKTVTKKTTE